MHTKPRLVCARISYSLATGVWEDAAYANFVNIVVGSTSAAPRDLKILPFLPRNVSSTKSWELPTRSMNGSPQEHGNNRMVGWLEGLEGLCSLFFAIPFGTLADRWRRDRVLRISSFIELGAVIITGSHASMCVPSDFADVSTTLACSCNGRHWQLMLD